ncbi:MAG: hypothetical protein ACREN4_05980 [Candidatus Dormibacteria bacterium]
MPVFGEVVGAAPVFLRLSPSHRRVVLLLSSGARVQGEYSRKIDWLLAPGFQGVLRISGRGLEGLASPKFSFSGSPAGHATLDVPNKSSHYTSYRALLELPQAGCYQIAASYPGGSWVATVAAGR